MEGFFPGKKYGGPPVSINNFCNLMVEDNCFIVTKNHDFLEKQPYGNIKNGWNDFGNCTIKYFSDKKYNFFSFQSVLKEVQPDILYLQGVFQSCIFPCLILAKFYNIKVVLAPRGELCKGAFAINKNKKRFYIEILNRFKLFHNIVFQSTSEEESVSISQLLGVHHSYICKVPNIPSLPMQEYSHSKKEKGRAKFVFLSRIHPKKNLLFVLDLLKNIDEQVSLDIYGSIEDEKYWSKCLEAIKVLPNNITVRYNGEVSHNQVHYTFSMYDAFIFPTFSENYGHAIIESLIVGTPVIISNNTPWGSSNKDFACTCLNLNDKNGFLFAIKKIIGFSENEFLSIRQSAQDYAVQCTDLMNLKKEYRKLFKK